VELTQDSNLSKTRVFSTPVAIATIACIGLIACLATLWATARWGIGVSADSTVYIGAARSLLATGSLDDVDSSGQRVPLVHYPPLLPVVIAGISGVFRIDPVSAARWLGAVLFGFTTILLGAGTWRLLNSSMLGIAAALLALVFTPMAAIHQMALSEPLYILFAFIAILSLFRYLNEARLAWFVAAIVATALAFLTRYAGAALVIAGALAILLLQQTPVRLALRRVALFSVLSCLPVAGWFLRNRLVSGVSSDFFGGKILDSASSLATISSGFNSASAWLLPGSVPLLLRIGVLFALTAAVLLVSRRRLNSGETRLTDLSLIHAGSYMAIVLATVLFLDGTTPLDDRMLLPLFAPLILLLLAALQATLTRSRGWVWIPAALAVGLLFLTNSLRTPGYLFKSAHSGRGYSAAEWKNSIVINRLKSIPHDVPIYGTLPSSIRFLTNLPARQLPNIYNPRNQRKNPDFGRQMSEMCGEAKNAGIVVVYFLANNGRWYPPAGDVSRACNLGLIASDDKMALYMSPNVVSQGVLARRTP
jgi:4-amino-4-deoxy-L-arabinose transferase-like glycosyltransferase